jgi:hypothetical protein
MSYKDTSAKQTQDYRDRFNHFDAPMLHYRAPLVAHAGFKVVSSARRNGFVPTRRRAQSAKKIPSVRGATDGWRLREALTASRAEAIRRLVELGLKGKREKT